MNAYKVLAADQSSHHGGSGKWRKGQWCTVDGVLVPCRNGIHYCRRDQLVQWLGSAIWLFEDGSPDETIDGGDKMVTRKGRIVERVETWNERTARLFAADCAEMALVYIPESHRDPFVAAINAARGFARGEIGYKELAAARAAAWAAAEATARATARATAARDAAARDAAWAAARATAARDAARAVQTEILFEYLDGIRG